MSWEGALLALFDDLEQQASGLHLAEREAEVAELSLAEYARVGLAARLHASLGHDLRVRLLGGRQLTGRLERVGEDWLLLAEGGSREWIVRHQGLAAITGLSPRADSEETWSVLDRLSLRSLLRRLSADRIPCLLHLVDDQPVRGQVARVGADFVEVETGAGSSDGVQVVPVAAIAAIQGQDA